MANKRGIFTSSYCILEKELMYFGLSPGACGTASSLPAPPLPAAWEPRLRSQPK